MAIVELEEGPRIIAQLDNPLNKQLAIGMPVQFVFRQIYEEEGVIRYGFKFRVI